MEKSLPNASLPISFKYLVSECLEPSRKTAQKVFFGEQKSFTNKVFGWIGDLKSNWVVIGDEQMSTRMILFSIDEWMSNRMGIEC